MKSVFALVLLGFSIISCSKISDQELFDQGNKLIKEKKISEAIKSFESLISEYPQSKLAPKCILQIASFYEAQLIEGTNRAKSYNKALELYNQVIEKYPDSEEAPIALFQSAFIYDNEFKNYDEATKKYNLLLHKDRNHKYSAIVQQSLDIMGIDLEEIINHQQAASN